MQQIPDRPSFSVSHASARRLDTCARAHFWAVYGSWGGWDADPGPARLAYFLKQGKSLGGVVGDLVHQYAATAFAARRIGLPVNFPLMRKAAHLGFAAAIEATDSGSSAQDPKRHPPVLEVFYGVKDWVERALRARADLDAALDALMVNEHFLAVVEGRVGILHSEDIFTFDLAVPRSLAAVPDGDVPFAGSWSAGDEPEPWMVKVYVIPDLVYVPAGRPGRRVVVDWKTGRLEDDALAQVGVYAAWLSGKDRIPPRDIASVVVYLPHYVERAVEASTELAHTARETLRAAAQRMLAYVVDGDPERNEPKPMEAFEQVPEGSKACKYCAFRRLCGRES